MTAPSENRMTLRVSRDGGRHWAPMREVRVDRRAGAPEFNPVLYPPCRCRRCTEAGGAR